MTASPSPLARRLYRDATRMAAALGAPRVARTWLADPQPGPDKDAEFGLLVLDDGAAGLYYAWLAGDQEDLPANLAGRRFTGAAALDVAALYLADNDSERSLGLAAINALTASLYRRAGYAPPTAGDRFGGFDLADDDCLGMVGYFPPLARAALAQGVAVRVLEKKPHLVALGDARLTISHDPAVLAPCTRILCTGATLINDTLDALLGTLTARAPVHLIGPSLGCPPDALFERGVGAVGGSSIGDGHAAWQQLRERGTLAGLAQKTLIKPATYPGLDALLARLN